MQNIPILNYKIFEFYRETGFLRGFEADGFELQAFQQDSIHLILRDKLIRMRPWSLSMEGKPVPLPKSLKTRMENQAKFRFGAWYQREGNSVFRLSEPDGAWKKILQSRLHFSQFEISPEGEILLIGSAEPQVPERKDNPLVYFGLCREGSARFALLFQENAEKPSKEILFPDEFLAVEKSVAKIGGPLKSFWIESKLIVCQEELGLIWCLDWNNLKVHDIPPPWPAMTWAFLAQHKGSLHKLRSNYGSIGVSQFHFPRSLDFFPLDSGSIFVVYRGFKISPNRVQKSKSSPEQSGLDGQIPLNSVEEEPLLFFEMDLNNYSIKNIRLSNIETEKLRKKYSTSEGMADPFWVHFDGTIKPFPVYVEPAEDPNGEPGASRVPHQKPPKGEPLK